MIASLWKTSDKGSREFFVEFFKQLITWNDYSKALQETKKTFYTKSKIFFPEYLGRIYSN
ncbi:MAG: hypothetical protein CO129_07030 [Ignavibacteriales bacterium CG_4_9_14_3_um_filter_34_10]|nr:MAG: hypothetical protein CO129_07030 [Ignavibacteriales bacterium CG_4_9_14_3_um_filter_34_10]